MKYFIIISFLQRFMCAFVMNGIHRNRSPLVHTRYYLLYFIGSMKNTNYNHTYICGNQNKYSWKKQYKNKKLIDVDISDKSNLFYDNPILLLNIII